LTKATLFFALFIQKLSRQPGRYPGILICMKKFKINLGYGAGTGNRLKSFDRLLDA